MKYLTRHHLLVGKISFLSLIVICFTSCKKDEIKPVPFASLALVNAVTGGKTAKIGSAVLNILNNSYSQLGLDVGDQNLYVWPLGDSLNPYFTYNKLNVQQGQVYSLFLTGVPGAVDGILIEENIPYRTDSTAGLRFINLAPNSNSKPINITLQNSPAANEVSNLEYKQYTGFKTYAGKYNSTYTFQIRNDTCAAPKSPLASFTLAASAVPRFANITLVIRQNGANGFAIFIVKNERP